MGTKRRFYEKDAIYHVSNRTVRGHALLTPNEDVAEIVINNLAWAADVHGVDVYYYVFQPDGFDMLVSSEYLTISQFMGDFEGLTAREINALHGESGKFFAGTFECTKIESDVQLEQFARIVNAPCRRGFVGHPGDWEGVSSWDLLENGGAAFGVRVDRTLAREIRRAQPEVSHSESLRLATSTHELALKRLPGFEDVSRDEYLTAVMGTADVEAPSSIDESRLEADAALDSDSADSHPEEKVVSIPAEQGRSPIGMDEVRQWPTTFRLESQNRRRPTYLTRNRILRCRHSEAAELRNLRYAWARKRLREGLGKPEFPPGTIPLHKTRPVGWTKPPFSSRRSPLDRAAA